MYELQSVSVKKNIEGNILSECKYINIMKTHNSFDIIVFWFAEQPYKHNISVTFSVNLQMQMHL